MMAGVQNKKGSVETDPFIVGACLALSGRGLYLRQAIAQSSGPESWLWL